MADSVYTPEIVNKDRDLTKQTFFKSLNSFVKIITDNKEHFETKEEFHTWINDPSHEFLLFMFLRVVNTTNGSTYRALDYFGYMDKIPMPFLLDVLDNAAITLHGNEYYYFYEMCKDKFQYPDDIDQLKFYQSKYYYSNTQLRMTKKVPYELFVGVDSSAPTMYNEEIEDKIINKLDQHLLIDLTYQEFFYLYIHIVNSDILFRQGNLKIHLSNIVKYFSLRTLEMAIIFFENDDMLDILINERNFIDSNIPDVTTRRRIMFMVEDISIDQLLYKVKLNDKPYRLSTKEFSLQYISSLILDGGEFYDLKIKLISSDLTDDEEYHFIIDNLPYLSLNKILKIMPKPRMKVAGRVVKYFIDNKDQMEYFSDNITKLISNARLPENYQLELIKLDMNYINWIKDPCAKIRLIKKTLN